MVNEDGMDAEYKCELNKFPDCDGGKGVRLPVNDVVTPKCFHSKDPSRCGRLVMRRSGYAKQGMLLLVRCRPTRMTGGGQSCRGRDGTTRLDF